MQTVLWLPAATLAFQNCGDCHTNPEPGDRMEFPAAAKCMACHTTIAKDQPAIQELAIREVQEPIPRVRVYVVSAGVYWNHRSHLDAGVKCETCHGLVAQMDVMANVTNVTTMVGCVDCHQQSKAGTGCEFCHEGK
jgi:hypothetical protein